ncbi:MAG: hypothetical protein ACKVUS_19050 [Saprospiraceae bacterium]
MSFSDERLKRILSEPSVPFRLGDYISRGFQFMNENFGLLLAFALVSGVISFFCQSMPYVGIFLSMAISPILSIGYSQFAYAVTRERRADFGDFFKGFSKIGALLLTYLLTAVVSLVAFLPGLLVWYQAGMVDWLVEMVAAYPLFQDTPELTEMVDMSLFWLGLVVMLVGALTVSILFVWALQITWFFDAGPLESLDASRKLIARNWGNMLGFLILSGIIAFSGVLLCGIGLLYTAPAMACAQFFAFADMTRLFEDDGDGGPDLIDHFIA